MLSGDKRFPRGMIYNQEVHLWIVIGAVYYVVLVRWQ